MGLLTFKYRSKNHFKNNLFTFRIFDGANRVMSAIREDFFTGNIVHNCAPFAALSLLRSSVNLSDRRFRRGELTIATVSLFYYGIK